MSQSVSQTLSHLCHTSSNFVTNCPTWHRPLFLLPLTHGWRSISNLTNDQVCSKHPPPMAMSNLHPYMRQANQTERKLKLKSETGAIPLYICNWLQTRLKEATNLLPFHKPNTWLLNEMIPKQTDSEPEQSKEFSKRARLRARQTETKPSNHFEPQSEWG